MAAETMNPTEATVEPATEGAVFKRVLVNFIVEERDVAFLGRMLSLIGEGMTAWPDEFGTGACWDGPYVLDDIEEQIIHGLAVSRGDYTPESGDDTLALAAFNLAKGYLLGAEESES